MDRLDFRKYALAAGTLALVGVFFASFAFGMSSLKNMDRSNGQVPSISVTGEGEVAVIPDIATVTITVRESADTVPKAQELVEKKVQAALDSLDSLGVEEKDMKTLSYYVNPKYENVPVMSIYPGPISNPRIIGYEVAQSIEIKVRKIDQAGEIVGMLGSANITEISGPSFTVDDLDAVRAEAKEKAIENAREKAIATASALGVDLGAITAFYEDNAGYYYGRDMLMNQAYGKGGAATVPEVSLPTGENIITSRVTITFNLD
jgi:uncharacterized protein YggE